MIIDCLQRHPFLRLLMPLAGGIVCGDAYYFGQQSLLPIQSVFLLSPLSDLFLVGIGTCVFLFLLFASLFSDKYRFRWIYGIVVFFCCFCLGAGLSIHRLSQTDFPFSQTPVVYQAVIREKPEVKERSILCRSEIKEASGKERTFLLYFSNDSLTSTLKRGDKLWIYTRLMPPVNNGNPDEFDYYRYLKRRGGAGTAFVSANHWQSCGNDSVRTIRQMALDCREKVIGLYRDLGFRTDELGVLSALTVGDKEELSERIVETYSVSGASHVLALSGLHIGFLYALLFWLLRPLWQRCPSFKFYGLLVIVILLWGFAFITGLSPSVVRSVVMFSFLAFSCLQPEKPLTLNTLAATAFLMLLYNPAWLFDVGFQLSFAAVTAIVLIQPKLYGLIKVKSRPARYVWSLMTVSVAAQIGTAPLVIFYFSRFSTHFLLTNLWVIPMVSLILYSAIIMLALMPFPFLQQSFASVVEWLLQCQNSVLYRIEHLPFSSIDGIWLDLWEVLLLYLVLVLFLRSSHLRTARSLYLSLFCLFGLVAYHSTAAIINRPQRSIVFYNIRSCPAVHCLWDANHSWLACADSLADTSRIYKALTPHWNRLHVSKPELCGNDYEFSTFSVHNHMVRFAGKRICLLNDSRWRYKTSSHPFNVDYLYISNGYKGTIRELIPLFRVHIVILDASLPDYYVRKLKDDCLHLHIPYVSISDRGTFRISL